MQKKLYEWQPEMAEGRKDIQFTRLRRVTIKDNWLVHDDMKIVSVGLLFN